VAVANQDISFSWQVICPVDGFCIRLPEPLIQQQVRWESGKRAARFPLSHTTLSLAGQAALDDLDPRSI
jgi:hypothetical protein